MSNYSVLNSLLSNETKLLKNTMDTNFCSLLSNETKLLKNTMDTNLDILTEYDVIVITNYFRWLFTLDEMAKSHQVQLIDGGGKKDNNNQVMTLFSKDKNEEEVRYIVNTFIRVLKASINTCNLLSTICDMHFSIIIITGYFNNHTNITAMLQSRWKKKQDIETKQIKKIAILKSIKSIISKDSVSLPKNIYRSACSVFKNITGISISNPQVNYQLKIDAFKTKIKTTITDAIYTTYINSFTNELSEKTIIRENIIGCLNSLFYSDDANNIIKPVCDYLINNYDYLDNFVNKIVDKIYNIKSRVKQGVEKIALSTLVDAYQKTVLNFISLNFLNVDDTQSDDNGLTKILNFFSNIPTERGLCEYLEIIIYIINVSNSFKTISCEIYNSAITPKERSINHILQYCINNDDGKDDDDSKDDDVKDSVIILQNFFPGNMFNLVMAIYQALLVLINIQSDFNITFDDYLKSLDGLYGAESIKKIYNDISEWYNQPSPEYVIELKEKIKKEITSISVSSNPVFDKYLTNALHIGDHNFDILLYMMTTGLILPDISKGNIWNCMMNIGKISMANTGVKAGINMATETGVNKLEIGKHIQYTTKIGGAIIKLMAGEVVEKLSDCYTTDSNPVENVNSIATASGYNYVAEFFMSAWNYVRGIAPDEKIKETQWKSLVNNYDNLYDMRILEIMNIIVTNQTGFKSELLKELLTLFTTFGNLDNNKVSEFINVNHATLVANLKHVNTKDESKNPENPENPEYRIVADKIIEIINKKKPSHSGGAIYNYQINKINYLKIQKKLLHFTKYTKG
jgi:hypothetical protein